MRTERASVSTTSTGLQPLRLGKQPFGETGGEEHVGEVAREAPLDAGPQHLDRDVALAVGVATLARCTCAIEAAATGSPNSANSVVELGLNAASIRRTATSRGNGATRSCSRSSSRATSRADDVGPGRQELAELHVGGPEPVDRARQPVPRRRVLRAISLSARERRAARAAAARAASTPTNAPSRASTKPARASRDA